MDDRRFDNLAKLVGKGASRRSMLKGLLGLGGAAVVTGTIVSEGTDARGGSVTRIPTPPPPTCPSGQSPCGGTTTALCCQDGHCSNGVCCSAAGQVRCGISTTCCDPGTCNTATQTCCDTDEDLCYNQNLCCASGTCSRLGNTDYCCPEHNVPCGLDCCASELQCCDNECCPDTHTCLTRVFPPSAIVKEETCCPTDQTCDNQCCDGTCFRPTGAESGYDRLCCPAGFEICENRDGTNSCIDPATQCCDDTDCEGLETEGCLVPRCIDNVCRAIPDNDECVEFDSDGCRVPRCTESGQCTYMPDDSICISGGCETNGFCDDDGFCKWTLDHALCTESGPCAAGVCLPGGECRYDPVQSGTACIDQDGICCFGQCLVVATCPACIANADCPPDQRCCSGSCAQCCEARNCHNVGAPFNNGVCVSGECQCTPSTQQEVCEARFQNRCGPWTDGCVGTVDCGICSEFPNSFCSADLNGICTCFPSCLISGTSTLKVCGSTDGCIGMCNTCGFDCTCPENQTCSNGQCVA